MDFFFRISLLIAGIVNFTPCVIAFLPAKTASMYGMALQDANLELLMRHRAVLFGLIGGLIIYAALTKQHYTLATLMGLASMTSFLLLYFTIDGPINEALTKVMKIDSFAILLLVVGYIAFKLSTK